MKTDPIYQLEVSIHQKIPNEKFILIYRFKNYDRLLKFKKKIRDNYPDTIEGIIVKRINTEIL